MALHVFTDEEVELGGENAIVYEQPDDTAAALVRLGFTSFNGGDDASSEQAALNATIAVDVALGPFWRGRRLSLEQALLLPSAGAYASDKRLLRTDIYEERFLRGYRLVVEKQHAGTLRKPEAPNIKKRDNPGRSVEYFHASPANQLVSDPDIWSLLSAVTPPL